MESQLTTHKRTKRHTKGGESYSKIKIWFKVSKQWDFPACFQSFPKSWKL